MGTNRTKFIKIPATHPIDMTGEPNVIHQKKRVCAYCRVSTDESEQLSSYRLQKDYYTQFIQNHPHWKLAGIYSDYARSGTSVKKRTEFQQMIQDCREGKIDLIITKSISRFARNTLDCLNFVRLLKSLSPPVAIYFERENINTLDTKSELLLTILSCIAQDEARNISENMKWSIQKKYQSQQARCPANYLLGYEKDGDGKLKINEEEAVIVRRIFQEYLNGKGVRIIAEELKTEGILSGRGTTCWGKNSVLNILKNEKYCGDVLMQKDFTVDFLTHHRKRNTGELPKYYLQDHHAPIIPREEWEQIQAEIKRRHELLTEKNRNVRQAFSSVSVFSNRLFCGNCGQPLTRSSAKLVVAGCKEHRPVWRCRATSAKNCKKSGYMKCHAKRRQEDQIKSGFMKMLAELKEQPVPISRKDKTLDFVLSQLDVSSAFNDNYFRTLIGRETVYDDGTVEYTFRSGLKVSSHL